MVQSELKLVPTNKPDRVNFPPALFLAIQPDSWPLRFVSRFCNKFSSYSQFTRSTEKRKCDIDCVTKTAAESAVLRSSLCSSPVNMFGKIAVKHLKCMALDFCGVELYEAKRPFNVKFIL